MADADYTGRKTCARCAQPRDLSDYTKSRQHSGGLKPWCKQCCAASEAARRANPVVGARMREADRVRRSRNLDAWRAKERLAARTRAAKPGALKALAAAATARLEAAYKRSDPAKNCIVCGVSYCNLFGKQSHKMTCSPSCSRVRRQQCCRDKQAKRRALVRGADAESINVFDVFDRDGWRCHLCGRRTPKRLRGSRDGRAPELDHIVTLADGGSHTWGNVACACRECNMKKGSKSAGQLGLQLTVSGAEADRGAVENLKSMPLETDPAPSLQR